MEQTKGWDLADGRAQNEAGEKMLALLMRHHPRDSQRRWRTVRPAAAALLGFAYEDLGRRITRRRADLIRRQIREVFYYPAIGRAGALPPPNRVVLSDAALRQAQAEIRKGLARLVLLYRDETLPGAAWWMLPRAVIVKRYDRLRADAMVWRTAVEPRHMHVVLQAGEVLADAVPWIRFCELCGRAFFKVKRQRLCGRPRCKAVFHGRKRVRKGADWSERRGRPRRNYAAEMVAAHTAWLGAATGRPPAKD
ncbi:MAG: hypothetical protein HY613_00865 [Candidatus Rokubacteria bacterium]|nr:hypothetical protein [Candidatus Rokubacteria bacterium]